MRLNFGEDRRTPVQTESPAAHYCWSTGHHQIRGSHYPPLMDAASTCNLPTVNMLYLPAVTPTHCAVLVAH